jgi:hypothetical protein
LKFISAIMASQIRFQARIRAHAQPSLSISALSAPVVFGVEPRGLGRGDLLRVALDRVGRGLAPLGQIGIGVGGPGFHRGAVDGLLEAFGQRRLGARGGPCRRSPARGCPASRRW